MSAAAVASAPLMKARLRPWEVISRRTIDLGAVSGFEDGFDRRELLAGSQEVLGGPAAEQQADGLDEDGFAGAGLARQDVERRVQTRRTPIR